MELEMLKITNHVKTGKLAGFQSLNTSVLENSFCSKMRETDSICKSCYAVTMEKRFKGMRENICSNGDLLSASILNYSELPAINSLYFRFHSVGELINEEHFINFVNITNKNPRTTFVLWTKRKNIVDSVLKDIKKPENLILVFSDAKVDNSNQRIPANFDKMFSVYSKEGAQNVDINCNKKCKDCLLCYQHNDVKFIRELLK